ncbi:MAG: LicD family protein [Bacteroidales bacterium]|jgi:lipopolysaccharide cholinephosphotransferase|nr:LicD family protein [Bacteroidales bacterium]
MDDMVLRKLQLTELEILDEAVRICQKNKVPYFLEGGTLLGAVRHKGFIPWDDDIDIGMLRKDYERFIKLCKTELNEKYYLQAIHTNKWCHNRAMVKLRKNNTAAISEKAFFHAKDHKGIAIEIFPFDFIIKNRFILNIQLFLLNKFDNFISVKRKNIGGNQSVYMAIKRCILFFVPFRFIHFLQRRVMIPPFKTKYVVPWNLVYGFDKQVCPLAMFSSAIQVEFEGRLLSAPVQWDSYLRQVYGDYMQIPPPEERRTHNLDFIDFGDGTIVSKPE